MKSRACSRIPGRCSHVKSSSRVRRPPWLGPVHGAKREGWNQHICPQCLRRVGINTHKLRMWRPHTSAGSSCCPYIKNPRLNTHAHRGRWIYPGLAADGGARETDRPRHICIHIPHIHAHHKYIYTQNQTSTHLPPPGWALPHLAPVRPPGGRFNKVR